MRFAAVLSFLICLSVLSGTAMAQTKHEALRQLEAKGYTVEYLGQDYGLEGWLIRNKNGQTQYGYSTPQGGFVLGMMFGPDAELQTAKQLKNYRARAREGGQSALKLGDAAQESAAPTSEKIYADVERAKWFALGDKSTPYIYTFINPMCDHCVDFWQNHMKPLVEEGALHLRMIPFGAGDENRAAAAALLSAGDDAGDMWRRYAAGDNDALQTTRKIPDGIYKAVDFNTSVFQKWDLPVLPFSVYRAPVDGKIKVISGVPENVMMMMADFVR